MQVLTHAHIKSVTSAHIKSGMQIYNQSHTHIYNHRYAHMWTLIHAYIQGIKNAHIQAKIISASVNSVSSEKFFFSFFLPVQPRQYRINIFELISSQKPSWNQMSKRSFWTFVICLSISPTLCQSSTPDAVKNTVILWANLTEHF